MRRQARAKRNEASEKRRQGSDDASQPGRRSVGRVDRESVASFLRFVVCGGGVGLLSSGVLMLMTGSSLAMSIAVANAIVTVLGTLLANELHSRITFGKGRASIRVHIESTGTAVVAYLFTTGAMLTLETLHPHADGLTQQAVYLSASGLAGIGRFIALKLVVFARRTAKTAVPVALPHATHTNTPTVLIAAA